MKNYKKIIQGSDEWHAMRWGKIGGTLAKGLLTDSQTLFIDILSQRSEEFQLDEDSYVSDAMARGSVLEKYAIEATEEKFGIKFESTGWMQCEDNELLGISPDGITEDETISIETKCPSRKKHTETILLNEIPKDNIHQCLQYFVVNPKLEKHIFVSYRPEHYFVPLFTKVLELDTVIDLGTKTKPSVSSVAVWVKLMRENADILFSKIKLQESKTNVI
jgi:hypothetical protein